MRFDAEPGSTGLTHALPVRCPEPTRPAQLDVLGDVCLAEAIEAFGLAAADQSRASRILATALSRPARRFAERMAMFDDVVGTHGLQQAGVYALQQLARRVVVSGQGNVPPQGPLLLVSNHPGIIDSVALFAHLPRADLRVIAARRRLLTALPQTARHLLFVSDDGSGPLGMMRDAVDHLGHGGALLNYPGGRIEPDPALHSAAAESLAHWCRGIDIFARRVPTLTIVPVIVSGVLSRSALRHPLTRLRRGRRQREWLAATLQMLGPSPSKATGRIVFGPPIQTATLADHHSVGEVVTDQARQLIETCDF